ncbi:MAG: hypothetical protein H7Y11_00930, partial [Armatimonadetes bacterium]|nr:hypothetical protein [Anaerolineae bacterium]
KIDGQSLANMDDVPWYGVGPSEPTPIPILGPDIIDPRQMDTIRRQAELAAQGKPFGVRQLPPPMKIEKKLSAKAAALATASAAPVAEALDENVMQRRLDALARRRANAQKNPEV